MLQVISSNTFSRAIGFIIRASTILAGIVTVMTYTLGAALFFAAWYLLPFLLAFSLIFGFQILIGGYNG